MKKQTVLRLVAIAAALLALVWLLLRPLTLPHIDAVHPVRGVAVQAVYATGTVEATVMMPIAPRTASRLMELRTDEGQLVKKGQVLAQMEDEDLASNVKQLQAREAFARKEYERNAGLAKTGATAKLELDRTKADWEAAQAATHAAQAQLSYMTLLAPEDGLIIQRDGEEGQMIPANQAVFWLSCCAPLRISAEVDEEDISQVQPGQDVLIRADAFPNQIFKGTVQAVTPRGDPIARSYRVRVSLPQDTGLRIGMTAEVNIIADKHENALLVPTTALDKDRLWLIQNNTLKTQKVTLGARGPQQTEIKNGVTETDAVVLKPDATWKEGKAVRANIVEQAP